MWHALLEWVGRGGFMPHGNCYLWKPGLVWLEVVTNAVIGLAYVVIAALLALLVRRIEDIPFRGMYYAFAAFILSCGVTHFFDVIVIWEPIYWVDGAVRAVTAVASVATAALLPPLIPQAARLARGVRSATRRGIRLQAAVDDLETMYEQAKALEETKAAFFANVSHELRTPLTLIAGRARQLAEQADLPALERAYVDVIIRNAQVLQGNVDNLMDIASLDSGRVEPRWQTFDLAAWFGRVAVNFDGLATDYRIRFEVSAPASMQVRADPAQLHSVVVNLLSNAFKFTPDGGTIRCVLSEERGTEPPNEERRWARISVEDSGPGVPREAREAIFDRFYQVDQDVGPRFSGTGLGLVVAQEFTEVHGGTIEVRDAESGGAHFLARLPIILVPEARQRADTDVPGSAVAEAKLDAVAAQRGGGEPLAPAADALAARAVGPDDDLPARRERPPRVVVVEDNRDMNEYICELARGFAQVYPAYDAAEGLALATRVEPDVVVVDLMMPQGGGARVVDRIRAHHRLADAGILVVTARADDATRVQLLRRGADDFLQKPFRPAELLSAAAQPDKRHPHPRSVARRAGQPPGRHRAVGVTVGLSQRRARAGSRGRPRRARTGRGRQPGQEPVSGPGLPRITHAPGGVPAVYRADRRRPRAAQRAPAHVADPHVPRGPGADQPH